MIGRMRAGRVREKSGTPATRRATAIEVAARTPVAPLKTNLRDEDFRTDLPNGLTDPFRPLGAIVSIRLTESFSAIIRHAARTSIPTLAT